MTAPQNDALIKRATSHLIEKYSPSGNRIGWLMIASIFIESWDLYAISQVLTHIKDDLNPSPLMLGLAAGGVQLGAVVGSLLGGWLSDKIGRRFVFLGTMIAFVVLGAAQGLVPNMETLIVIRFLLGIPLGTDIANGFTYIMESLPKGRREVMGNRWQFMFAVGSIAAILMVWLLLALGTPDGFLWRFVLAFGAVPAIILFFLRKDLPETAVWLVQHGRFREAKKITADMYGDPLDMLPDHDVEVERPKLSRFLAEIRPRPKAWAATKFAWISCWCQNSETAMFGFFIPLLLTMLSLSDMQTQGINLAVFVVAAIAAFIAPQITPKIGHRGISISGFAMAGAAIVVSAIAFMTGLLWILPIAMIVYQVGHYWDASNGMTIASMVAPAKYRGTASGFAYIWVKIPAFIGISLVPMAFDAFGEGPAILIGAAFSLIGLLSAIFILPEVYNYDETTEEPATAGAPAVRPAD